MKKDNTMNIKKIWSSAKLKFLAPLPFILFPLGAVAYTEPICEDKEFENDCNSGAVWSADPALRLPMVCGACGHQVGAKPVFDLVTVTSVSKSNVDVGDEVTYTITITNKGTIDATNVGSMYTLSESIENPTLTPSQGTEDGETWTVGDIASGDSVTLTAVGTVGDGTRGAKISELSLFTWADQTDTTEDGDVFQAGVLVNPIPVVGSCTSGFDWDNSGWTNGDKTKTITLGNGMTADVAVSTDVGGTFTKYGIDTPYIDSVNGSKHLLGGVSDLGIIFDPDANTGTSPIKITLTFSEPVYNGSFLLTDIDASGTERDDKVTVTSDVGEPTVAVLNTTRPTATATASNVVESTKDISSEDGNEGTARVIIPDGAKTVTLVYEEVNTNSDDHPARAAGFLGNLAVCKAGVVTGTVKDDAGANLKLFFKSSDLK